MRKGNPHTLLVRIAAERNQSGTAGFVVTFDDVTELLAAQRNAAWADIARRIAHEIKNPLTPIQLSAERLRRKYQHEVGTDPDVFRQCTETIIRQVGDIGRLIDEFSSFARMPAPVLDNENLVEVVKQALFLQEVANPDITYRTELPVGPVVLRCDARQVSQVLTNLLLNAAQAIAGRVPRSDGAEPAPGEIVVRIHSDADSVAVEILDNGRGLPAGGDRNRLIEPYVSTRPRGTGLGLAIVARVMDDHHGKLALADRIGGGACLRLIFPLGESVEAEPAEVDARAYGA